MEKIFNSRPTSTVGTDTHTYTHTHVRIMSAFPAPLGLSLSLSLLIELIMLLTWRDVTGRDDVSFNRVGVPFLSHHQSPLQHPTPSPSRLAILQPHIASLTVSGSADYSTSHSAHTSHTSHTTSQHITPQLYVRIDIFVFVFYLHELFGITYYLIWANNFRLVVSSHSCYERLKTIIIVFHYDGYTFTDSKIAYWLLYK